MKLNDDEVAEIRNKLQSCQTVLEFLKDGKEPSEDIVNIAYDNLQKAISLLDENQD